MSGAAAPVDVLVIDAVVERHRGYKDMLGALVGDVVTVPPGEQARALARDGRFSAVLVHLDVPAGEASADLAMLTPATNGSGPPVIVIASHLPDLAAVSFDYVPLPLAAQLLPSRLSCQLELARLRRELAGRDARIDELVRQLDMLAVTAADGRRTSEALRRRVGDQVHRSKNLLSIMQSLVHRSLGDGRELPEARDALMGRLRALSRAYHLSAAADGEGTEVAAVVEAELAGVADRATANGPSARLLGSAVQTFTLAIHELTTNASKHGALRSPDGSVAVGWTFFEYGADRYLEVAWTERGGAPPKAPSQYGFGLALVSSLAGANAPTPNVTFDGDGFACRMRFSQDVFAAE